MQLRSPQPTKITIDMTPMIDIVFQLLIFFILTLQISAPEGDFEVRMPQVTAAAPATRELPPLLVRLISDRQGNLRQIQLNGRPLSTFDELQQTIERGLGSDAQLIAAAEVAIASDFDLSYEHTIAAITAVSGRIDEQGKVVKLIERIRFQSPK